MQSALKEQKPVIYSLGATKVLFFCPYKGKICFVMHWHERLEILYIRKGKLEFTLGSEKGIIEKGQALIIPPGIAHTAVALEESEYDVVMFDIRSFYNETEICKKILPSIFEGNADYTPLCENTEIIECIKNLIKVRDSIEEVSLVYYLLHLFIKYEVFRTAQRQSEVGIKKITDYIEQNFDKPLNTSILSKAFGYTSAHFCRKFKKATGLTPVAYIKIYRLERAFKMIKHNEGQIGEIALKCGFDDTNYFTRCFKAHYNHPPTYYKK